MKFFLDSALVDEINHDFLRTVMHAQLLPPSAPAEPVVRPVSYTAPSEQTIFAGAAKQAAAAVEGPSEDAIAQAAAVAGKGSPSARTVVKDKADPFANVGRNDPCPCGSGKKYKHCHGANA